MNYLLQENDYPVVDPLVIDGVKPRLIILLIFGLSHFNQTKPALDNIIYLALGIISSHLLFLPLLGFVYLLTALTRTFLLPRVKPDHIQAERYVCY